MNPKGLWQGRVIRFLVVLLWMFLLIGTFSWRSTWVAALLAGLILLHAYEVPKFGIPFGKSKGFSRGYSIFMTFVFGITWYRMLP